MIKKAIHHSKRAKEYFLREHGKNFFIYLAISAFTTLVDFGLLYSFTNYLKIFYLISATISYFAGTILGYSLNRLFNFKYGTRHILTQFSLFVFISFIGLILNDLILLVLVEAFKLNYLLAKIISVGIVFFWNYLGNKYITFK